jgi:hypothetical protein
VIKLYGLKVEEVYRIEPFAGEKQKSVETGQSDGSSPLIPWRHGKPLCTKTFFRLSTQFSSAKKIGSYGGCVKRSIQKSNVRGR